MRTFLVLWRRELLAYALSPTAYLVMVLFLAVTGAGFWVLIAALAAGPGSAAGATELLGWVFLLTLLVAAPLLTMRLFAEERRSGTFETLMTAPVRDVEVVLAKYAGSVAFFAVMLLPTVAYGPLLRAAAAVPPPADPAALAGVYAGALLVGSFLLAIGLLASALTRSQIAAGLLAFATIALFLLGGLLPYVWHTATADRLGAYLSPVAHMADFSRGVFDTRPFAFYAIGTAWVLFATVRVLESRRWR
jgi:ABC-2 type transport system permease protein